MTDIQAKRVRELINNKEHLEKTLGLLITKGKPSPEVRMELNFRIHRGMYEGYPFGVNFAALEMTEIDVVEFVTQKLRDKIKVIDNELSNY